MKKIVIEKTIIVRTMRRARREVRPVCRGIRTTRYETFIMNTETVIVYQGKPEKNNIILSTLYPNVSTAEVTIGTLLLNDGNRIPALSFGTLGRIQNLEFLKPAVIKAIESGYRQIDTAAAYLNEEVVGEAIAEAISRGFVTREELFITTKLHPSVGTREAVIPGLEESLNRLKLDYADLCLIHNPDNLANYPVYDISSIWEGLEDAKKLNLTRSIGVSNFNSSHINRILADSKTVPAVHEIEVNPTFTNLDLVAYSQSLNMTVLSYAPFGFMVPRPFVLHPTTSSFDEPIFKYLARKYGKTTSQIVLRYLVERGTIPIPRSKNMKHIKINKDIFDFSLTKKEIFMINKLNQDVKVYNFDEESVDVTMEYFGLGDLS